MFKFVRSLLLLSFVSVTLGCGVPDSVKGVLGGDIDNSEPPSPLVDFTETADVLRLWSDDVVSGTDELFIKLVPVLLDGSIYIADTEGNIAALAADSGKQVWRKDIELPITGGPGADKNLVMVGTSEGDVVSLLAESGEEVWKSKVSSEILSSPREANDVVIVRTIDGKIFAIDAISGERLWIYDRTVPALTLRGTSTPVISNDIVIAGFDGGRVTALELKTGKLLWERRIAISRGRSELERMVDVDAQPLILDDVIYITSFQANVTALSLESGQILWQRDISSHTELGADTTRLYVTNDEGHVWALDRFSGASIWKQDKLKARQVTGPTVFGNKVVVGDLEGYLHWLDKETGEFAARSRVSDSPILTSAITNEDKLFAYSSDGTLAAFAYADNGVVIEQKPNEEVLEEEISETVIENNVDDENTESITKEVSSSEVEEVEEVEEIKEEEGSFFGKVLDIFTGDPDDEDE